MSEKLDYELIQTKEGAVKVRNYTTGADEEAVMLLLMESNTTTVEADGKLDAEGKEIQTRVSRVDATVQVKLKRLKLQRFVIDVDGKEEGAVDAIYEMRTPNHKLVVDAINKITKEIGGLDDDEKKDSGSNTTS